jgi:membrane fusion protein (multidrug efflux system)
LVSSKLAGYVRGIAVRDNQLVQRGTVLAEVDPTDFANHVADADAQIEVAEANRDGMLAAITEARTGIVQAEAAIASAKRKLAWLNAQVALYRPLAKTGAEPSQTYNQYLSDRDQTEQDVLGREASLVQARARLVAAQAQLRQADAQVKSAQVKQQATQNDLGHSRLIAPISGRVASSALRPGQYVQPGQRLLSIVPTNDIYISANFKETQIGLMRPGQPATVHVDALPGIRFHGYVESITPGTGANFSLIPPQNATGNFTKIVQRVPVRIYLVAGPQSRRVLVPGLSVRVEVDTRSAKNERERIEREATDAK